jgi:hypothetical protein
LLCSWATLAEGLLLYVDGEPFSVNWLIKRSNFCWVKAEIRWFELWSARGRGLSVLGGSKTHSRPIPKHSFRRCEWNILVFLCESPTTDPYCETTLFLPRRHEISCEPVPRCLSLTFRQQLFPRTTSPAFSWVLCPNYHRPF